MKVRLAPDRSPSIKRNSPNGFPYLSPRSSSSDRVALRITNLITPPLLNGFLGGDVDGFVFVEVLPPRRHGLLLEEIPEIEHEVGFSVRADRVERTARITWQDEIWLPRRDTGLADDPRNGIGHQTRAGRESAELNEVAAAHGDFSPRTATVPAWRRDCSDFGGKTGSRRSNTDC